MVVNGQFLFEDCPALVLKSFGAVGLELEWEKKGDVGISVHTYSKWRVACIITQKNLGVKIEESKH